MRNPSMVHMISLLLSLIILGSCMTDLDYSLSKSKGSNSSITDEESFHGSSSAKLSVKDEGNYARIIIYLDEPIPIEELDSLNMEIDPILGDGNAQIELFLDGDGDDSYSSDSSSDARLRTTKEAWSEMGMQPGQWSELDGTELNYGMYGDDSFGIRSFKDCQKALSGKMVVRLYITIYKDPTVDATIAYVDYIKIGNQVLSFEPLEREKAKSAPKSASPGSEITYTITYGNNYLEPIDLVIKENYDPRTTFVSADTLPDDGTNNIWTIHHLPPGKHGQIKIKVRTGKLSCNANIDGKVSGIGYASSSGILRTDLSGYTITNSINVSSGKFNLTASASTLIRPIEGSIISFREHGSGFYSSEERLTYSASKVFVVRITEAYRSFYETNTSPALLRGLFNSSWYASCICEDKAKDLAMSEIYAGGRYLDLDMHAYLGKTSSYFDTASNFSGSAEHISRYKDNVFDERFLGNFSLTSKTRVNSEVTGNNSAGNDWLACCLEDSD